MISLDVWPQTQLWLLSLTSSPSHVKLQSSVVRLRPIPAGAAKLAAEFTYSTNAFIYDEAPNKIYVTCRGENGANAPLWKLLPWKRASPGAGVVVVDVSDAAEPRVLERWAAPNRCEGQDRRGSLLVVAQIFDGLLYTFEADNVGAGPIGSCQLSMDGALHVRLHLDARSGRLFALVTSGFASNAWGVPGLGNLLCAVDVTDRTAPFEACRVREGVPRTPEGVFIHGDCAYLGGVTSSTLAVFDLSQLGAPASEGGSRITFLRAMSDPVFKQCVGQNTTSAALACCGGLAPGEGLLLAALWASPAGGLGVFRLRDGGVVDEMSRLVLPELAMANRVVLLDGGARVLLPLETSPGGVALVDVADARRPRLLARHMFTDVGDTCYCACAKGNIIYAFAAKANRVEMFEIVEAGRRMTGEIE